MREEDRRVGPRGKLHLQRGREQEDGEARTRDRLARASTRSSLARLSEGVPGEKIFPINTAKNGRMNASKNCRMTNCGGSFSSTFSFSSRFQRIFENCRAISPLDSPLLQEFLSFLLFLVPIAPIKHSKLYSQWCIERASSSHKISR